MDSTRHNTIAPAKVAQDLAAMPRHHLSAPAQPVARFLATIAAVNADTLLVQINGGGDPVVAIKPLKVCPALDQDVDGYTYSYTIDATQRQRRTSTSGSNTETQTVVPRFIVGDVVEIGPAPGNLADYAESLAGVRYQVVNHPAYWSKEESS